MSLEKLRQGICPICNQVAGVCPGHKSDAPRIGQSVSDERPRTRKLLDEISKLGYSAANDRVTSLCWELERDRDQAIALLGLAATAFRTGFFPPLDWLPRAHELLCLPETNQPPRLGVTRWPFVESPGEFAERLEKALVTFDGYVLGAVRNTLIENPPVISEEYLQSVRRT